MANKTKFKINLSRWTVVAPALAWVFYALRGSHPGGGYILLLAICLIGAVMASVHHAEVVAHKVGEPFGTLVLTVAVTIIEVSLIISLMHTGGPEVNTLARDTVFATIMIILSGIIGICLVVGSYRYRVQVFELEGVNAALAALIAIAVITLVLPNYTTSIPGPWYSPKQLGFVAIVTLVIYISFILVQTVRHRSYFLVILSEGDKPEHLAPPSVTTTVISLLVLLCSLLIVVLLADNLAPGTEHWIERMGAPKSLIGVLISAVVLMPEGISAIRAAQNNHLQISLNQALGSALASTGLTIPVVALVGLFGGHSIELGIDSKSTVLLLLSSYIVFLSLRTGRTNILQGVILLVIFALYLFLTIFP